jgi:hypothetical protein
MNISIFLGKWAWFKRLIIDRFKYRCGFFEDMAKNESSREEQVGFHKGALTTLAKEREEMMRILQIVEQLMQVHIKSLKGMGVDLEKAARSVKGKKAQKPIEDMLK